jgi:hypothetical protein
MSVPHHNVWRHHTIAMIAANVLLVSIGYLGFAASYSEATADQRAGVDGLARRYEEETDNKGNKRHSPDEARSLAETRHKNATEVLEASSAKLILAGILVIPMSVLVGWLAFGVLFGLTFLSWRRVDDYLDSPFHQIIRWSIRLLATAAAAYMSGVAALHIVA